MALDSASHLVTIPREKLTGIVLPQAWTKIQTNSGYAFGQVVDAFYSFPHFPEQQRFKVKVAVTNVSSTDEESEKRTESGHRRQLEFGIGTDFCMGAMSQYMLLREFTRVIPSTGKLPSLSAHLHHFFKVK